MPELRRLVLPALLVPAIALLFVGGPSWFDTPSLRYLWNMGHLILFALVTVLWHRYRPLQSTRQFWLFLGAVTVVSLCIEALQLFVGRSFSFMDLLRNLIGSWLAWLFINPKRVPLLGSALLGGVLLTDLSGLVRTAWLDWQLQSRAPIIENFEQPFAFQRWQHQFQLSDSVVQEGQYSGSVTFEPAAYATFKLRYPLRDWRGYSAFQFAVFNPQPINTSIVLRIHDRQHEHSNGYRHQDRFNTTLMLSHGWNVIRIPVDQIALAPQKREMDMRRIVEVQWFMSGLEEAQVLYFDDIRLTLD